MIDIDREVRDSLTRQSVYAPDGADLLAGVHTRSRRYARRRRIVIGGVAAALAVLVSVPLLGRLDGDPSTLQPADGQSQIELVPAAPPALRFPFTPGWLPDGLLAPQVIGDSSEDLKLQYNAEADHDFPTLILTVSSGDITRYEIDGKQPEYRRRSTTVGGKSAELLTPRDGVGGETALSFRRAPGKWIFIEARGGIGTDAVLRRLAANLKDEPIAGRMPFEFKLAPKGFTLSQSSANGAHFEPPADRSFTDAFNVWVDPEGMDLSLRASGQTRYIFKGVDGTYQAAVRIDHQKALRISAPVEPALSRKDFERFVDGVTMRPPGS